MSVEITDDFSFQCVQILTNYVVDNVSKNFPLKQISLMLGYFFPKDFIFFCQLLNSAKTFYFKAISMQESIEFLIVEKLNDLSRNCTSVDLTL